MDTKETILHEIEERKNFTTIVHTVQVDLDEKVQNFTKTVDLMKSEFKQKIDEHIGGNSNQFAINQNIAKLQKNTIDTISHEILRQRENMTKIIDNVNTDLNDKMKNFTSNVVLMQSSGQKKIDEHIEDNRNQFTEVKQDIANIRTEMEEKIENEIFLKNEEFYCNGQYCEQSE
ncbi:Hypothetical predicted protein [Mytilus galloprovincialis]|uniref:Uncharacterized protein n=1 Tax=Mytilus galloprovincialis TaxID=29158 RepID=A0A8B6GFI6_MYTGA|nr:Hypothetical predicted protein [Mytilus galloprovincialis]